MRKVYYYKIINKVIKVNLLSHSKDNKKKFFKKRIL
jgi:hypothetical protein